MVTDVTDRAGDGPGGDDSLHGAIRNATRSEMRRDLLRSRVLSSVTSRQTGLALAKFGQSRFQFLARKVTLVPGQARSIRLRLTRAQLPDLE